MGEGVGGGGRFGGSRGNAGGGGQFGGGRGNAGGGGRFGGSRASAGGRFGGQSDRRTGRRDRGRGRARGGAKAAWRARGSLGGVVVVALLALAACGGTATPGAARPAGRPSASATSSPGTASAAAQPAQAASASAGDSPSGSGASAGPVTATGSPAASATAGAGAGPGAAGVVDVAAAAPGSVDLEVCVPFQQVLRFEAQRDNLAQRSQAERQAVDHDVQAALARIAALLKGAGPAAVAAAVSDLGRDTLALTPGLAPRGAAHPGADVLALRQYLAVNCGGEPGTAAQERAIGAAVAAWLPKTGMTPRCIRVAGIDISRADPAYATADLVESCQEPGGGTALLHRSAAGAWRPVALEQAIPCGQAPDAVIADLFSAVVPTLCGSGSVGSPRLTATPLTQSGTIYGATYKVGGSYPQLAGLSGDGVEVAINASLRRAATAAVTAFLHDLPAGGGSLNVSYKVTYPPSPQPPYLSIQILLLRKMAGAAHPSGSVETFTFDLRSGYRYHLADLFRPGADYIGYLTGVARAQVDARYGQGTWRTIAGSGGTSALFQAWSLTPTGIEVTFNGGTAALGSPTVLIPYSDPVLTSLARPYTLPASPPTTG